MSIDAIPDAILELILLRVDSHFCLLDASSTCKRWRRVVAEAGFLHQFCTLHGPPVAGVYYQRWDWPWRKRNIKFQPLSPAIPRHRYSLNFLKSINAAPPNWRIRDSRGTLLLLDLLPDSGGIWDMVVCDPLTQRYKRVLPAPMAVFAGYHSPIEYLVDGEAGGIGMSNFRVVCLLSLNKRTAEFSCCILQETKTKEWGSKVRLGVTTGRDGEDRIVVLSVAGGNMTVFVRLHGGGCEWTAEKTIELLSLVPWPGTYFILAPFVDLNATRRAGAALIVVMKCDQSFSVDIETNEVERARQPVKRAHPCELPWPPTLRACTQLLNI
ncbi:hypothetical protein HU200_011488 [Digitaria exilis]|uniref:F-box domain-containing protein n=1 Tax=Digitaria exilis TaxID=1010633 RepID=A0A835FHA7_9POAL|nr:hypothetical protein HU200_011488 [Digitaria exilis]